MDKETWIGLVMIAATLIGIVYSAYTGQIVNFCLWLVMAICMLITQAVAPDPYGEEDETP